MTPDELGQRRDEIIASRGPWRADNLRLAKGVYTIGDGASGRESRVRSTVQTIADLTGSRLKGLRVLDLGCGEGGFALELGKHGAQVVAIEGRPALAEKAEFARDALGLHHVTILRAEPRRLSPEEHGFFDVVLALGVLDRLEAPALFEAAKRIGAVCKGFALIASRLAARPRASRESDGGVFRGSVRSVDGESAFLLTRVATLALLGRCGFTSILETLDPEGDAEAPCLSAFKGRRVSLQTAPQANAVLPPSWDEGNSPARKAGIARLLDRARR